jgi:hypothetical protein
VEAVDDEEVVVKRKRWTKPLLAECDGIRSVGDKLSGCIKGGVAVLRVRAIRMTKRAWRGRKLPRCANALVGYIGA